MAWFIFPRCKPPIAYTLQTDNHIVQLSNCAGPCHKKNSRASCYAMASSPVTVTLVASFLTACHGFMPSHLSVTSLSKTYAAGNTREVRSRSIAVHTPVFTSKTARPVGKHIGMSSSLSMQASSSESFGVVITGGAGGVGFAYADEFLARGHRVVICDISPKISDAAAALQVGFII
jgi:hypothetical protein